MKTNLSRILSLSLALTLLSFVTGCGFIYDRLGGPYWGKPVDIFDDDKLSKHDEKVTKHAKKLINHAFKGLNEDKGSIADYHVHFFGKRDQKKNDYIPSMDSIDVKLRPMTNLKRIIKSQEIWKRPFFKGIFMDAAYITDEDRMNEQNMKRLVDLVSFFGPPKFADNMEQSPYRAVFYLMAIDGQYKKSGELDELSYNYVSNEYIVKLVKELNKKIKKSDGFIKNEFRAVGSINPMRSEWLNEIDYLEDNKVKFIKWRPPTMEFNPDDIAAEFYRKLKEADIGILTHIGESTGIGVSDNLNQYAGPLRMKKAVNEGVKVVLLHMGRAGKNNSTEEEFSVEFLEFMKWSQEYASQPYGEMSVVPYGGTHLHLENIINGEHDLANRMVNGSDYPAVTPYIFTKSSLRKLENDGYINKEDQEALDLIYHYNPLLFDFVLKRTISIDGMKIPDGVFLDMNERQ